ncbi:PAB1 [Cyberlindnera jadinii]|uniref:Polyadenylate-binding protein n=1 Tax=Cyberlindnera jadinii (strain ATCC 18201 / CBS 1600 / BCRC 20928 / JCM 3617 / NBRC 0987 / NRRL Y-1542) TaxID=983966 RepID=A0A0H5CFS4_CYBJN|nr:polyadenylate binding protein [Cyberlindnera jadinii NRRL Y-1542]ODV73700.1 polyadenylate binding protein [Cyberlindnera jadinii NRRL Y-1542]CEP23444.1 PAB1 [Cyberlindnera jadinii]
MSAEQIEKTTQELEALKVEEESPVAPSETTEKSEEQSSTPAVGASLYVGELEPNVSEATLFEVFTAIGPVSSIRVCRDAVTKRSLGYAYVNFDDPKDGQKAIDELNYSPVNGRPMRIMLSQRDPSLRRSGAGNIFIKNLDAAIDNKALHDTFSTFGRILSCKVATDLDGKSKGFGFVHYETAEAAEAAIEAVNGMDLNGQIVYVAKHLSREERESKANAIEETFTNVYVKNIDLEATAEEVEELFKPFGAITSFVLQSDAEGKSKGFGFVNFAEHESATKAIEELNDTEFKGKKLYVGRAQKKYERREQLKKKYDAYRAASLTKSQGVNLFIKNLDDTIDDDRLREEFSPFGTITSAKVMRDEAGKSKGFGFVAFTSPDEASKALSEMNQHMLVNKPLYVALAQKKEARRSQIQQQIMAKNQMRMQQAASGIPGQFIPPVFYGQQPGVYPPRGPMPGQFMMQGIPRPGQGIPPQGQWAGRQIPNGMYGPPQFQDYRQGQRGFNNRGGNRRQNREDVSANLAQALANAPEDQHKRILGEELYSKVVATGKAQDPESAGKITGMLLGLENDEIISLLGDDDLFKQHFDDALEAYEEFKQNEQQQASPEAAEETAPAAAAAAPAESA